MGKQTVVFIGLWLITPVLWDLYILLISGPEDTISQKCLDWMHRWPIIPLAFCFGLGVLVGHLFLPQQK